MRNTTDRDQRLTELVRAGGPPDWVTHGLLTSDAGVMTGGDQLDLT